MDKNFIISIIYYILTISPFAFFLYLIVYVRLNYLYRVSNTEFRFFLYFLSKILCIFYFFILFNSAPIKTNSEIVLDDISNVYLSTYYLQFQVGDDKNNILYFDRHYFEGGTTDYCYAYRRLRKNYYKKNEFFYGSVDRIFKLLDNEPKYYHKYLFNKEGSED